LVVLHCGRLGLVIIKKEVRLEKNVMQTEEDVLEFLNDIEGPESDLWSDRFCRAFKVLNDAERICPLVFR
jgi:hypothetical protein